MPSPKRNRQDEQLLETARKRFSMALGAWREIRKEAALDLKMVSGDQWEESVKNQRETNGRPALTDNRLHAEVQQITNRARQQRPQPKINPGDSAASEDTAKILEGHIRHIQYASQSDIAHDHAVECGASCGLGFFRVTTEYVKPDSFDLEPRIRRILDQATVYFDPNVEEPDYSDAEWCFVRRKLSRDEFKFQFPSKEPMSMDATGGHSQLREWASDENVWVAEYWHVEKSHRRFVLLDNGVTGYEDEIPDSDRHEIINDREVVGRKVIMHVIDGGQVLETHEWLGDWIPIIPVQNKEMVVDGARKLISSVRFARDPQRLLNTYESSIAEQIALSSRAPWVGAKGSFKDKKWQNANNANHAYLEYEPVTIAGNLAPPPSRNQFEAPIQAMSAAAMQQIDAIKASFGYVDNIIRPSQADISGVAVTRRETQRDMANFHLLDNLTRSLWHEGRVLLDLIQKLYDNPRAIRTMEADGKVGLAAVHRIDEQGELGTVSGMEHLPHHRLDLGIYDVTISTGPSYNTQREEERDALLSAMQADPQLWAVYGDVLFHLMGYQDLEERAKMALPPAIQQAIAAKGQPQLPPAVQAQLAQLMQQNQGLKQGIQQLVGVLRSKQIEAEGRIKVQQLKVVGEVTRENMKQQHEASIELLAANMAAVDNLTKLLHQSELGSTPGPGMGNNAPLSPVMAPRAT